MTSGLGEETLKYCMMNISLGLSCTLLSDYSLPQHFHPTRLSLRAVPTTVYKPSSYEELQHACWRSIHQAQSKPVEWIETQVLGPDAMDRHTLAQLARMAANASQRRTSSLGKTAGTNSIPHGTPTPLQSFPFGWDSDENGFRGFVFRSRDNSTVVLSIKGTALQGPTSKKDNSMTIYCFPAAVPRVDVSWVFSTV
ncbi:hypothetical protein L210DRAFT_3047884 [Boletus edulis BED1]|uniref:triacylglycerol lipase n=1 Tax=Boletus edulis BED1 TaxID=1328754 RepID=A0AAD4C019_BOLED|nr:hypothetical protein L210DRAFT_3047884 [Boletus edulis BED1]